MSTTVISKGFIALLQSPIHKDQREEMAELLHVEKTGLNLNDAGTIIYQDLNANKPYSEREFNGDLLMIGNDSADNNELKEFIKAAKNVGLSVQEDTIQPYICIWYNGSDCPLYYITEEEFRKGF